MSCPRCESENTVSAMIGVFCHDCNLFYLNEDMCDNFTGSLIERYSDNPPENNRPGKDGMVNDKGEIV
jgi:hypothetical protein